MSREAGQSHPEFLMPGYTPQLIRMPPLILILTTYPTVTAG